MLNFLLRNIIFTNGNSDTPGFVVVFQICAHVVYQQCWSALLARSTSTSIGEVCLHQRTCRSYNCESAQVQVIASASISTTTLKLCLH